MNISIYQIQEVPIGRGGMGQVYAGTDPKGNKVAIKEMLAEYVMDSGLRARFHQEAQIMTQLEHPSIVRMFASFEEHGNLYLVMEYVDGENLEEHIRHHGPLSEGKATALTTEILKALGYAHRKGYVHRDIKPGNIMIRKDGRACLLDFGIAKDMNRRQAGLTTGIMTIGTDGYMSPEQAEGYNIDIRSDIYSLGCVLFFMLTGQHAYPKKGSEYETRISIINGTFPKGNFFVPDMSEHLQTIMEKATSKNMLMRFQSAREFELELCGGITSIAKNDQKIQVVTVGREGCDIVLAHPKVSRRHIDIERNGGVDTGRPRYRIRDRSTNGTLVDGTRIHHQVTDWMSQRDATAHIMLAGEVAVSPDMIVHAFLQKFPEETDNPKRSKSMDSPDSGTRQKSAEIQEQRATGWLIAIYLFAILGGWLGIALGLYVFFAGTRDENGIKMPRFIDSHRKAAIGGAILAFVSMISWLMIANT